MLIVLCQTKVQTGLYSSSGRLPGLLRRRNYYYGQGFLFLTESIRKQGFERPVKAGGVNRGLAQRGRFAMFSSWFSWPAFCSRLGILLTWDNFAKVRIHGLASFRVAQFLQKSSCCLFACLICVSGFCLSAIVTCSLFCAKLRSKWGSIHHLADFQVYFDRETITMDKAFFSNRVYSKARL